jgi:hypothetical protein
MQFPKEVSSAVNLGETNSPTSFPKISSAVNSLISTTKKNPQNSIPP